MVGMDRAICEIGVAARVAVSTVWSPSAACARAGARTDAASTSDLEIRIKFPLLNNSKRAMRGFNFGMISRAYPDSVAARGKSTIVRQTPSARKHDRVREVSWLPDQNHRPPFPDGHPNRRGAR